MWYLGVVVWIELHQNKNARMHRKIIQNLFYRPINWINNLTHCGVRQTWVGDPKSFREFLIIAKQCENEVWHLWGPSRNYEFMPCGSKIPLQDLYNCFLLHLFKPSRKTLLGSKRQVINYFFASHGSFCLVSTSQQLIFFSQDLYNADKMYDWDDSQSDCL